MHWLRKLLARLFLFELIKTKIEPEDVIIYRHTEVLSEAYKLDLYKDLQEVFPHNTIVILTEGARLEIVRCGAGNAP